MEYGTTRKGPQVLDDHVKKKRKTQIEDEPKRKKKLLVNNLIFVVSFNVLHINVWYLFDSIFQFIMVRMKI